MNDQPEEQYEYIVEGRLSLGWKVAIVFRPFNGSDLPEIQWPS